MAGVPGYSYTKANLTMITTVNKSFLGKTIYGYPQGNAARYSQKLVEFVVRSIGPKYIQLQEKGHSAADIFNRKTGELKRDSNTGYIWFASVDDFQEWDKLEVMRAEVRRWASDARTHTFKTEISPAHLKAIHTAIFKFEEPKEKA
jgi:hypothetical protein